MNNVFIVGNGNMAWALIKVLSRNDVRVAGVFGKTDERNRTFAQMTNVPALTDPEQETKPGDIVLFAVKDDVIPGLADRYRLPGRFVFHTAGSVELSALSAVSFNHGVFYLLQRVLKGTEIDLSHAPVCIEASNEDTVHVARELAGRISDTVYEFSSQQRKMAHLAAIFVSNFPNFMLVLGAEILKENGLPDTLLNELVRETFTSAVPSEALNRQTGPAKRADLKVISAHLKLLEKDPYKEAVYRLLSMEIMKRFHA
jgi:predicted short-subunit dehydrogenase-like oxidoreductase (DUF2520 family)